ncbi:MAG: hypothetical protein DRP52_06955 [Planctomycetota bacterium]|nr:MAG: hypothetical protein DRP52_06955 [Planctomycetota bacterium]
MGLFIKRCGTYGAWKAGVVLAFLLMPSLCFCAENIIFEEHFENGLGGFIINNSYKIGNGLWHLSTSCEVDGGTALYYGQDDTCNYDIGIANRGVAESPPIDLHYVAGPIELRFKYYLEVEPAFCGFYSSGDLDLATVEISADEGYYVTLARNCWAPGLIDLGAPAGWTLSQPIDLSDYAGSIVQLRFGFNTVDYRNNGFKGFFVDDIIVSGPPCRYKIGGEAGSDPDFDVNDDCVVDIADFAAMAGYATMEEFAALAQYWLLNCYLTPDDLGCVLELE